MNEKTRFLLKQALDIDVRAKGDERYCLHSYTPADELEMLTILSLLTDVERRQFMMEIELKELSSLTYLIEEQIPRETDRRYGFAPAAQADDPSWLTVERLLECLGRPVRDVEDYERVHLELLCRCYKPDPGQCLRIRMAFLRSLYHDTRTDAYGFMSDLPPVESELLLMMRRWERLEPLMTEDSVFAIDMDLRSADFCDLEQHCIPEAITRDYASLYEIEDEMRLLAPLLAMHAPLDWVRRHKRQLCERPHWIDVEHSAERDGGRIDRKVYGLLALRMPEEQADPSLIFPLDRYRLMLLRGEKPCLQEWEADLYGLVAETFLQYMPSSDASALHRFEPHNSRFLHFSLGRVGSYPANAMHRCSDGRYWRDDPLRMISLAEVKGIAEMIYYGLRFGFAEQLLDFWTFVHAVDEECGAPFHTYCDKYSKRISDARRAILLHFPLRFIGVMSRWKKELKEVAYRMVKADGLRPLEHPQMVHDAIWILDRLDAQDHDFLTPSSQSLIRLLQLEEERADKPPF